MVLIIFSGSHNAIHQGDIGPNKGGAEMPDHQHLSAIDTDNCILLGFGSFRCISVGVFGYLNNNIFFTPRSDISNSPIRANKTAIMTVAFCSRKPAALWLFWGKFGNSLFAGIHGKIAANYRFSVD